MVKPGDQDDRRPLFDDWADRYDDMVEATDAAGEFPFAGYAAVLERIVEETEAGGGAAPLDVLDLGTGTGALAGRLAPWRCQVTVTDFSPAMLEAARDRLPEVDVFVEADLRGTWPAALAGPFDRIVSAYVFHEFEDAEKVRILATAARRLRPGGRIVIGDVAFDDDAALEAGRERWADRWDGSEHYWRAAAMIRAAGLAGLRGRWARISACAGVFVFEDASGALG